MRIRHFDNDYVRDVLRRLAKLAPDARPRWGRMTPADMIAHLIGSIRYSLGKAPLQPDRSTFLIRTVVRPLLIAGLLPMPKNMIVERKGFTLFSSPGDVETLHAVLEEYLALVQTGELSPPAHPALGPMGIDDWARIHFIHFEHHLKQFGV